MSFSTLLRLSVTLSLLASAPVAAAPLLIDDFNTAQQDDLNGLFENPDSPGSFTNRGAVQGAGILGGERDMILGTTGLGVAVDIGGGQAQLDGFNITMEWDGIQGGTGAPDGAAELPVTDLTDGGTNDFLAVSVLSASGELSATLDLEDANGDSQVVTVDGVSDGVLAFSFDSFTRVDPTQIVGVSLSFRDLDDTAWSLTLGPVGTFGRRVDEEDAAGAVPEPAAALLFGAGLLVTAGRRRGAPAGGRR